MFAPNDVAFAKLPKAKLDTLMKPGNRDMHKTALGAHIATGLVTMAAIEKGLATNDAVVVATVNNMPLIFKREGGMVTVNGARIVKPPKRVDMASFTASTPCWCRRYRLNRHNEGRRNGS